MIVARGVPSRSARGVEDPVEAGAPSWMIAKIRATKNIR